MNTHVQALMVSACQKHNDKMDQFYIHVHVILYTETKENHQDHLVPSAEKEQILMTDILHRGSGHYHETGKGHYLERGLYQRDFQPETDQEKDLLQLITEVDSVINQTIIKIVSHTEAERPLLQVRLKILELQIRGSI